MFQKKLLFVAFERDFEKKNKVLFGGKKKEKKERKKHGGREVSTRFLFFSKNQLHLAIITFIIYLLNIQSF